MPKHLYILIFLIALGACRQEKPAAPVKESLDFKKGETFLYKQNDSAFYYFNKVASASKDSLEVAMAYNNMASIQLDAGDYYGSQESVLASLRFVNERRERDRSCISSDYNELGMTHVALTNYDEAIAAYDLALKFNDYPDYRLIYLNNKALAYQKKERYREALSIYKGIMAKSLKQDAAYARALSNMARTKWLQQPSYNALPELQKALSMRRRLDDRWGLNASYAHLADYYQSVNTDSAKFYAKARYKIAQELDSPDDLMAGLQALVRIGTPAEMQQYFKLYESLADSVQTARNAAKNQFALIRYNAEKNKTDNLRLQKENAERNYEVSRQRMALYTVIFIFLVSGLISVGWYRKRKLLQALEKNDAIRETYQKASKTVHDTLANDIYRVMKTVQHHESLDRELLVDDIDDIYQRARDISYDLCASQDDNFQERIAERLKAFAADDTRVLLIGNEQAFWERVNPVQKFELKYILQELMVNMQKHSGAANVRIKFEQQGDYNLITYADDGVGLPEQLSPKNGLRNTGNRIKGLNGSIIFDKNTDKGLLIRLSIPTA